MPRRRSVTVEFLGRDTSLGRTMTTLGRGAGSLTGAFGKVAGLAGLGGITVAAYQATSAIIGLSGGFEESMAKIVGLVGISRDQVDAWKEDILELSGDVAKSPVELADAMFFITSAGLRGQEALDALNASAHAAAGGLGETKDVAFAVVSAVNAYGSENLNAAEATDILTNAVRLGNTEASTLAPVLGNVIPIAAELGVSFNEVGGAIAAMTRLGATANTSAIQLRQTLATILDPSKEAATALESVGLSAGGLRQQLDEEGLMSVLSTLRQRFLGNDEAIAKVFGNVRALTAVLNLAGNNIGTTIEIMDKMENSTGVADEAFQAMAETANFKFRQALTDMQVVGVEIGQEVLPILVEALEDIGPVIATMAPHMRDLIVNLAELAALSAGPVAAGAKHTSDALDGLALIWGQLRGVVEEDARAWAHWEVMQRQIVKTGKTTGDRIKDIASWLVLLTESGDLNDQTFQGLVDTFGASNGELIRARDLLAANTDEAEWFGDAIDYLNDNVDEQAYEQERVARAVQAATDRYQGQADALNEYNDVGEEAAEVTATQFYEYETLTQILQDATEAQESLAGALRAAADPVFKAIDAVDRYNRAQEDYNELVEEGEASSEELQLAQIDIAKAALDAQDSLDSMDFTDVAAGVTAVASALGMSEDDARNLLVQLGILDNANPIVNVTVRASEFTYAQDGNRIYPDPGEVVYLARGGIAQGATNAVIGEGMGDEAVIPLNSQGISILAAAMSEAMELGRSGSVYPASDRAGSGRPIVVELKLDGKTLARKLVGPMSSLLADYERGF